MSMIRPSHEAGWAVVWGDTSDDMACRFAFSITSAGRRVQRPKFRVYSLPGPWLNHPMQETLPPLAPGTLYLVATPIGNLEEDRKSTRLNSSHSQISYAVFCLKKKR